YKPYSPLRTVPVPVRQRFKNWPSAEFMERPDAMSRDTVVCFIPHTHGEIKRNSHMTPWAPLDCMGRIAWHEL
ncbi:hypothetical protein HAX54_031684, partial [Datura stramonium]|nr:hypothetical protein [Datura stramonium]